MGCVGFKLTSGPVLDKPGDLAHTDLAGEKRRALHRRNPSSIARGGVSLLGDGRPLASTS